VKLFEKGAPEVSLAEIVTVFHRWIQQKTIDEPLIDVADYKHVTGGPGILLVGFESSYAFDIGEGRRGLAYVRKRNQGTDLSESLAASLGRLAVAALLLQSAPAMQGRLSFDPAELQITFLDRLTSPNSEDSFRSVVSEVERALGRLEGGGSAVISRIADNVRRPLRLHVRIGGDVSLRQLARLARTGAEDHAEGEVVR
jgi:hypothetical protein